MTEFINPPLNVEESDTSPSAIPVWKMIFPDTSVTDNGDGSVTILFKSTIFYFNATTYFKYENGQLNLYVNSAIQESWEYRPQVAGDAMGVLGLTYS